MSTQSGIVASQELISSFANFIASKSRAFTIKIANESLVPSDTISGSSSLEQDFKTINSKLAPDPNSKTNSCYLFVRINQDALLYIFISFIPENESVRSRILYASTQNTLLRELGNSKLISKKYHITDIDEISYANYKDLVHQENSQLPYTEDELIEKDLQKLSFLGNSPKRLPSFNPKSPNSHSSSHYRSSSYSSPKSVSNFSFQIDDELIDLLSQTMETNLLINCYIDIKNETINLLDIKRNVLISNLVSNLNSSCLSNTPHPKYSFFYYSINRKLSFIYTCPSGSKVKERMIYATNKQGFINSLSSQLGSLHFDLLFEVGDTDEIDLSKFTSSPNSATSSTSSFSNNSTDNLPNLPLVDNDISSSTRTINKFSRPKGPRRR
ncbi:twinfilin TWF1 [Ascoidea rubescens DSM 1968]|uniref:Actin depolymerizing protein n=1 Tax=Ascoidea rubescens DSM 1968 TaxID=1344418 RepID=A0A1D2VS78_9ASCO|nr:actin depolymerizing protein [Ascoidea rubescens DSM 1968]ODV64456.1 actin depolymerizing protein [Ascoidea rubescens DSM 1968]